MIERKDGGFAFQLPSGSWLMQRKGNSWSLREWITTVVRTREEALQE